MSSDGKKAVEVFAGELNRLRVLSGMPSLMRLAELSGDLDFPLARATISDKLTAKSPPRWEFVVSFVSACREYAGRAGMKPPSQLFNLDWWDTAYWRMLAGCDSAAQERRLLSMARKRLVDTLPAGDEPASVLTASSSRPPAQATTLRPLPATPWPIAAVRSAAGVPEQLPPATSHMMALEGIWKLGH